MKKRLCVFCGSKSGQGEQFIELARELGEKLAQKKWGLVYGGATVGLMGAAADAALSNGTEVIGVIPHQIVNLEIAHKGLTKLIEVDTMHSRKYQMYQLSDAFCILPGGFGTLDEFFEILTWKQLKYHDKPIIVLNHRNYFKSLLDFLQECQHKEFISREHMHLFFVAQDVDEVLNLLSDV